MKRDYTESPTVWKHAQEWGLNRLSFGLGRDISPLLPGIDSGHSWFKIKQNAVEAFGRHLKGADASVPFSFGGFFGNS